MTNCPSPPWSSLIPDSISSIIVLHTMHDPIRCRSTFCASTFCLSPFYLLPFWSRHFVAPHFVSLRFVALLFVALRFVALHFVALHFAALRFVALHFVALHFVALHFGALLFGIKHFASPDFWLNIRIFWVATQPAADCWVCLQSRGFSPGVSGTWWATWDIGMIQRTGFVIYKWVIFSKVSSHLQFTSGQCLVRFLQICNLQVGNFW
jgi:hypothetical protein